jgi:hypothetical protein
MITDWMFFIDIAIYIILLIVYQVIVNYFMNDKCTYFVTANHFRDYEFFWSHEAHFSKTLHFLMSGDTGSSA